MVIMKFTYIMKVLTWWGIWWVLFY
jgi:hypothetical protein